MFEVNLFTYAAFSCITSNQFLYCVPINIFLGIVDSLLTRIKQGESQTVEFKFEINDARKIAETISAFSNTNGGSIFIGIKDNGSIAGVRSSEEFHMIECAAQLYCKSEVYFDSKQYVIDKKEVLEIIIFESEIKPVLHLTNDDKWLAHFRYEDANYLADPVMLEIWKNQFDNNKPSTYTKNEDAVLHLLSNHNELTISKISNLTKLKYNTCIKTISQLMVWSLIKNRIVHGKLLYSLF